MPITVTFAREIVREAKDNSKLLSMLAGELAKAVDRDALAEYLLDDSMAKQLLAQRLAKAPDKTLSDLERLAKGDGARRGASKTRSAAAAPKAKAAKGKGPGKGRRHRLTAVEVEGYKRKIVAFLGENPGSNRKAITDAVGLPTPSIYNRLMGELKTSGMVRSQGQKAKTVYSLTSGGARATRKTKTKAKSSPRKAAKKSTRKKKVKA